MAVVPDPSLISSLLGLAGGFLQLGAAAVSQATLVVAGRRGAWEGRHSCYE
ncbi:hypothetical protein OG799_18655 [Micromonospora sp. NBC_00898]|uniref:hypothetical protein n=1 Tax=Micromonospora sp. NBC_00898 TaxID=2975981 RepID=UPI0038694431|nr:hypothetical protein OG799_18655 [Micromonospora sp. NBC_00898]